MLDLCVCCYLWKVVKLLLLNALQRDLVVSIVSIFSLFDWTSSRWLGWAGDGNDCSSWIFTVTAGAWFKRAWVKAKAWYCYCWCRSLGCSWLISPANLDHPNRVIFFSTFSSSNSSWPQHGTVTVGAERLGSGWLIKNGAAQPAQSILIIRTGRFFFYFFFCHC